MKNEIKKYPIVIIFFVFLFCFSFLDSLWPKRERSELENRQLAQYTDFTIKGVIEENWKNSWMASYDKYIKDQFILRDEWINAKSRCESIFLKLENNKVWYGSDDTMFQKLTSVDDATILKNKMAIASFIENHPNQVTTMLVPSASLIWKNKLPFNAPIIDEGQYLDDINNTFLNAGAEVIDLRDAFTKNSDMPLYYKTDHHWTTDGAYLAYEQLVKLKGLTPFDRTKYTEKTTDNFLGTNYSKSRKYGTQSESIVWYDILNPLTIYKTDGFSEGASGSVYNADKWEAYDKYGAFLRGNNGYSILEGNGKGNILIIKDSYANSFIPFLVDNYAKIGIIDLRSTMLDIDKLMESESYSEVLVLYNFQTFTSDTFLWKIGT